MNFKIISVLLLLVILLILLPPVIIGEIMYNWDRTKKYDDLEGFHSLQLMSSDNLKIQSWYTNTSTKLMIVVHGHTDHSRIMNEWYGSIFENMGYDLFFIDLRNHGRSDMSKPISLGVLASKDIIAALEWVNSQNWEEVVLFGTSMGSIANIVALDRVDPELYPDKIILDSTFIHPIRVIDNNLHTHHVPKPYRKMSIQYLMVWKYDNFDFPDIKRILNSLQVPILVLHGDSDEVAPVEVVGELDQVLDDLQYAIIAGGEHSRLFLHPEFTETINDYLGVKV